MKNVDRCPVCLSTERRLEFIARDVEYELPGDFPVYRCGSCELAYDGVVPEPHELGRYYPADYYSYEISLTVTLRLYFRLLSRFVNHSTSCYYNIPIPRAEPDRDRALDVGIGSGLMATFLSEAGWNVVGLDFSRQAALRAKLLGKQVVLADAQAPPFRDQTFDLIVASHVVEHVYDPVAALVHYNALLRRGGRLLVAVPNFDSGTRRIFGPWALELSIPRHIVHFNQKSLSEALTKAGFGNHSVRPTPNNGFFPSVLQRAGISMKTQKASRLLSVGASVGFPIDFLMNAAGHGGELLAIAQKD